jgi:hypothetical protein
MGPALALLLLTTMSSAGVGTRDSGVQGEGTRLADLAPPIRATFYYPWFPEVWHPDDHYKPTLGRYDSGKDGTLTAHVAAMKRAGLDAAISSWWGRGHPTDRRLPQLLEAAQVKKLRVAAYYESEGTADPTVEEIKADVGRLRELADAYPAWLRIAGRPVLFVYNAGVTSCADVIKWRQAAPGWYLNLKVFPRYATCASQPDSWHQYSPSSPTAVHLPHAFNVSPGFFKHGEPAARLARDLDRFKYDISRMAESTATWHLVTSFNEWGEGTAIESAEQWRSASGYGTYVDALREILVDGKRRRIPPTALAAPTRTSEPAVDRTAKAGPTRTKTVTVVAAGDIACPPEKAARVTHCAHGGVANTIVALNPDAVLGLGDLQYQKGERVNFERSYHPTWGRFYDKTYPAPGNHEWLTPNAQGYRDYYRRRLSAIGVGDVMYYSFNLGGWHFISLDSDCSHIGGCGPDAPMVSWLKSDLAANNGKPTIVYQHHPRWSSGDHGSDPRLEPLHTLLVNDKDVEIHLSGHDHLYERFGPMGATGPQAGGLRHFVVGTGGANHVCGPGPREAGSEVLNCTAFGVLKLTLRPDGYDWQFVAAGSPFTDAGSSRLR